MRQRILNGPGSDQLGSKAYAQNAKQNKWFRG